MYNTQDIKEKLNGGFFCDQLAYLYSCKKDETKKYADRYLAVIDGLESTFGEADKVALFSAPGRTEIGGNHTDHQHGCVLAGSVNLDVVAAVKFNGTNQVRVKSEGYDTVIIDLDDLEINKEQYGQTISLIKGVLKKFSDKGVKLCGFDAYAVSNVLKGSGLSSSAAFEILVATIVNEMFANGGVSNVELAQIGQFAENVYFGKPSGLLDQMASSVGSVVAVDFKDNTKPVIKKVELDLNKYGYALCVVDSGADHADLTHEYAAITVEMKLVAQYFGKEFLREVDGKEFMTHIKEVRAAVNNDRAILRAMHFFNENQRAQDEAKALEENNFDEFLRLNKESGRSSYMYLQNVYAASMPQAQAVSLALAMCDEILGERGSYRVHGGGFAGTVQAFVPFDMLDEFKNRIEAVFGEGMCHVLSIRPVGGYVLK